VIARESEMASDSTKMSCGRLGMTDTDSRLLERVASGRDPVALEALMNRHGPLVLGACGRVLCDPRAAEDAFLATFRVLASQAATLVHEKSISSWLYRFACRLAQKTRASATHRTGMRAATVVDAIKGVGEVACWEELGRILDAEVDRLPASYRAAIVPCGLEAWDVGEAARQLNWKPAQVQQRLTAGLEMLRKRLAVRGVPLSAQTLFQFLTKDAGGDVVPERLVLAVVHAAHQP
jgi:DNA-directed RNA polymerase specialized sigma24 family protein